MDGDAHTSLGQHGGGGQAGDAAADHGDVLAVGCPSGAAVARVPHGPRVAAR